VCYWKDARREKGMGGGSSLSRRMEKAEWRGVMGDGTVGVLFFVLSCESRESEA
jgi:hypothetical protein